jgi:hypothetical protein
MAAQRPPLAWPVQVVLVAGALAISGVGGWFAFLVAAFYGCEGSSALYRAPSDSVICTEPLRQFLTPLEIALVLLVALAPLGGAVMTSRGRGARWLVGGILAAGLAFLSLVALVYGQQSVSS